MPENRVHHAAACRIAVNSGRNRKAADLHAEGKPRNPLIIVVCLTILLFAAVLGRLGYLQLFRHSEYLAKAQRQQQHVIEITPKRGAIYDRNMHPLAMSIPVDSAFAVPSELGDQQLAARLLSGVLGIPREVLEARLESSHSFVWIVRKLPPDKKEAVEALNLKGVYFQKENQRIYPKRDLASHVLGFVDLDEKGLGGIEHELDAQIRGKSEKIIVMADARQRWFDGGEAQRERGANVILTLDEKIQYIAERELAVAIGKTHAMAGTVMVMNPNNGEILALANWPKFNPNAANESTAEARMNRAVTALYEPGSTFKLITLAAAFDQGITTPGEVFDCENGAVYVAGHRIRDHKPFGMLNVAAILAQSSDVGAIKIALRLGAPKFYDYIRAFGFGQLTGVDLPGEQRNIAAAGKLVGHLDRIDLDGAGSGSHANSTHQRRLRNCQRRDALQAARHCGTEARRVRVTCGGRTDPRRAAEGNSPGNGGDTTAAHGRRSLEWDGAVGAAGWLDGSR
jgi:cell division protein FtsI (penicillin-binding protein 3)